MRVRPRRHTVLAALFVMVLAGLALLAAPAARRAAGGLLPRDRLVQLNGLRYGYRVQREVRVPMPDGVSLAASVYLPTGARPVGTVLVREPYGRLDYGEGLNAAEKFARNGFAVVVEDLRGTHDSGGEWLPYAQAVSDGAATLDWIVRQPWSNGRVGTFGCSALGETQLILTRAHHPALRAIVPLGAGGAIGAAAGRYSYFGLFEGGIFELASGFGWFVENGARRPDAPEAPPFDIAAALRGLPVADLVHRVRPAPNGYDEFMRLDLADPAWHDLGFLDDGDLPDVPTLEITTWGDQTVGDTLAFQATLDAKFTARHAARPEHHLIIAPGTHCHAEESAAAQRFGMLPVHHAAAPYRDWYVRWFDRWLRDRGPGLAGLPPVLYFMLGEDAWLAAPAWPPPDSRVQRYDLDSDGHANGAHGDGRLQAQPPERAGLDEITDDPAHPVPTRGGPLCCTGNPDDVAGPMEQAEVEARADVLVYTSAVLAQPLRIAGPLRAMLTVSSSAPDADFVARLVDVSPDGRALSLQEGALRAREAAGIAHPRALVPGRPTRLEVDMRALAVTIAAGHRLRLDVASSSFPRLERNLHTTVDNRRAEALARAVNRVHHGGETRSWIELPVLPAEAVRTAAAAGRAALDSAQTP